MWFPIFIAIVSCYPLQIPTTNNWNHSLTLFLIQTSTAVYELTMKAQKYCFYLLTLLILPIYATARGGKHSGLDADDWQPITNINNDVKIIGQFAVIAFNSKSNSNLLFERVVSGESRFSDGFYYRLVLEAKHGAYTRHYKAIVLDQPWAYERKLTNFNAA